METRLLSILAGIVLGLLWIPVSCPCQAGSLPLIVDHRSTNIDIIPEKWIEKAKQDFVIAYGHTSHGSQLVSGMSVLAAQDDLFAFNSTGSGGALKLIDHAFSGDLGHNGDTSWASRTRDFLDRPENSDVNMVMWSWCGGVSDNTREGINTYLNTMSALEQEYPHVTFVYMTGHLDGTGLEGNLHARNEQIREFCRTHGKVLFDFADIESFDPDGNSFLEKYANDGCYYDSDGDGSRDANWAQQWCSAHPGECSTVGCAHSQSLNCDLKGRAVWWMLARLAGWNPGSAGLGDVNGDGDITIVDALFVARCAVGLSDLCQASVADVDCNHQLDIRDALLIARRSVDLPTANWCSTD